MGSKIKSGSVTRNCLGIPCLNRWQAPNTLPSTTTSGSMNTTIDMLARSGKVSKLVQAFEVLLIVFQKPANTPLTEEHDDPVSPLQFLLPHDSHCHPQRRLPTNLKSINIFLRNICGAGHVQVTYARQTLHILHAIDLDPDQQQNSWGSGTINHEHSF
jgi:hypothetical protein